MKVNELLPVGSVVLLKNAKKRIVIIGIMQIKPSKDGTGVPYDYVGVPYPEGYMGANTTLLFNHNSIQEISFVGFEDEEREGFVNIMQSIMEKTNKVIMDL